MNATSVKSDDRKCKSCVGSGSLGTEAGLVDCPDCGGTGILPHPSVLVEWRARDIERARGAGSDPVAADVRWLVTELRRARTALTEISALAEELEDTEPAKHLRFTATQALALFEITPNDGD